MRRTRTILGGVAACALATSVAACGDAGSPDPTATSVTTTTTARDQRPPTAARARRATGIKVMNSRYGRMLFDRRGRAIYLFTRERGSRSRCYGPCAVAWPPVYTSGTPHAGGGVDADLLGTTTRRGGRRQATYKGHPLYYYVTDTRPGQVTCQDVSEFGGTWLVVSPAGDAVR